MARKTKRKRLSAAKKARRAARTRRLVVFGVLLGSGILFWLIWPFLDSADNFAAASTLRPTRLYGAPTEVAIGTATTPERLSREFETLGYRKVSSTLR